MVYGSLGMPLISQSHLTFRTSCTCCHIEIIARQAHFLLDLLNPPKTTYRRFQQFISVPEADLRNEFVCPSASLSVGQQKFNINSKGAANTQHTSVAARPLPRVVHTCQPLSLWRNNNKTCPTQKDAACESISCSPSVFLCVCVATKGCLVKQNTINKTWQQPEYLTCPASHPAATPCQQANKNKNKKRNKKRGCLKSQTRDSARGCGLSAR